MSLPAADTATLAPDVYSPNCPTREVLVRVADKWTTLITGTLARGPHRFGELARAVGGVTPRVLSRKLRDLERDGLIERTMLSADPPAVQYSLTPLGETLDSVIDPLRAWAQDNLGDIDEARLRFDASSAEQDRTPWQRPRPMA